MSEPLNTYEIYWQSRNGDFPTTVHADGYSISTSDNQVNFYRSIDSKRVTVHVARWDCVRDIRHVRSNVDGSTLPAVDPASTLDPAVDAEDETRVAAAQA